MMTGEQNLEFKLKRLMEGGQCIVDYTMSDKCGAALIVHPSHKLIRAGVRGDWNMVLRPEDSIGPTPRIHGGKLRRWRSVDQVWDVADAFDLACTKQVDISLASPSQEKKLKRSSYTKMDDDALKDPVFATKMEDLWKEGWALLEDPRIGWSIAWGRVQELYKERRPEERNRKSPLQQKKEQLDTLRQKMASAGTEEDKENYISLLQEIKEEASKERRIIRRRSRNKWLAEGDAPTKYFFSVLKSKQARDQIKAIRTPEGTRITSERQIAQHIHQSYADLFAYSPSLVEHRTQRAEVLRLISKKVSPSQNERLVRRPIPEEIKELVWGLAKEKAPGHDGLTAEVLRGRGDGRKKVVNVSSQFSGMTRN
ncbi:hypothetical protein R1sor_021943 [Riccia sorocarpa]|uniref:Uncharacterized protein n=1 Tax=Riccia sorocarpa TaxID=122646 RepID=A0ABD3GKE2_9MARC